MKDVRNYLRRRKATKVEVTTSRNEKETAYLLSTRAALLSQSKDTLYLLSFVDNYNCSGYIPRNHLVFGGLMYHIDDIIDYDADNERFMEELVKESDRTVDEWYIIYLDGQEVYRTTHTGGCTRQRNQYLRERKLQKEKFDHMLIVDPAGNRTDFIFGQETPGMAALRKQAREGKLVASTVYPFPEWLMG